MPTRAGRALAEDDFAARIEAHRRELHVHCYRMVGSFEEAEDLVQETYLRAWNKLDTFDGGPLFRAWLYRIATNVCLDALRKHKRQLRSYRSFDEIPWIQPYPDRLLDEIAPPEDQPDAVVVRREEIELAYLAAIQILPPRQRAALILRDVLDWSAAETAVILETSVAAANSALQRARATLQEQLPEGGQGWSAAEISAEDRALLAAFIDAHERCDADAAIAVAHKDIRITMPPLPMCFDGLTTIGPLLRGAFGPDRDGDWKLVPTEANRMPTAASYLRKPGETEFRAFKFDVLRIQDGKIREITTFGAKLFPAFNLPLVLP